MGKQADQAPERAVSPFWTFSLRIYGQPGVPPACLTLQDEHGVDVNVLLFALYAASCGRQLASYSIRREQRAQTLVHGQCTTARDLQRA